MFRRILVPSDGTPLSHAAVQAAVALARACGGSLVVFHALASFRGGAYGTSEFAHEALFAAHHQQAKAEVDAIFTAAKAEAAAAGVPCECVAIDGDRPWEAIIAVAKRRRCDTICMASHGRRGLSGVLLGSETQKVLTHATLPVLVIR